MIQRQQTLWLLLSTVAAILTLTLDFAVGKEIPGKQGSFELDAGAHPLLLVLTIFSIGISGVTIFLFKSRKQQMILCLVGLLLSLIMVIIYISQMGKLNKPTLALWCILPFLIMAGYFMAFKLIRKDEKLIKTLDKLR
jgi:lipopolysaccharide export LptBFGC system permease protein LptF